MKTLGIALVVALSLGWALEPTEAGGRGGDGRGNHGSRGSGGRQHHHNHRGYPGQAYPHRPVYPAYAWPSAVTSWLYAPEPVYAAPPVYAPPITYVAPPVPPIPRIVEHPGGRYELRGDGVMSPYVWVWIPNPPAVPPPPPAPAAPPVEAPQPSPSPRDPARRSVTYRFVDDDGVTTFTDSLEKVPARFRAQAGESAVTR